MGDSSNSLANPLIAALSFSLFSGIVARCSSTSRIGSPAKIHRSMTFLIVTPNSRSVGLDDNGDRGGTGRGHGGGVPPGPESMTRERERQRPARAEGARRRVRLEAPASRPLALGATGRGLHLIRGPTAYRLRPHGRVLRVYAGLLPNS